MADYNVQMKQYNGTSFDNILPYASQALTLAGGGGATEIIAQARAGLSQIATGSYVGTGTYGESNPTVINCGFKPKLLMLSAQSQLYFPYSRTYKNGEEISGSITVKDISSPIQLNNSGNKTFIWDAGTVISVFNLDIGTDVVNVRVYSNYKSSDEIYDYGELCIAKKSSGVSMWVDTYSNSPYFQSSPITTFSNIQNFQYNNNGTTYNFVAFS